MLNHIFLYYTYKFTILHTVLYYMLRDVHSVFTIHNYYIDKCVYTFSMLHPCIFFYWEYYIFIICRCEL